MSEFQTKLDAIATERTARNDLAGRRVETSLAESRSYTDDLARTATEVVERVQDSATRPKTAAGWERPEKPDPNNSLGLDFEDPDLATEPTNRHPAPEPPRRGRHARTEDAEDDYSTKDWLA